ncbi:hypothetical protein BJ508DRAFT_73237 [Ascobolus immersus RN42]|uniref:F-box domain-containing protein n=1 Tax=Ascobolus immersus RN42 TaxID=1160509 RepID=A0A3N4HKQ6_ASCIM|nr:hypothetical protein BJ508DRAFT_73237 [Ascobolus immersus RN42]
MPFLQLPSELRLEIYTHCTILTLLQLASTCFQTRSEIHSHPSIFMRSHGYTVTVRQYVAGKSKQLTIDNVIAYHHDEMDLYVSRYPRKSLPQGPFLGRKETRSRRRRVMHLECVCGRRCG